MKIFPKNKIILGDCLEIMKELACESIDLIYIDPPFFSNRHYEVIWGNGAELRAFGDRWKGGIEHYIGWMVERLKELHRILKKTGSIYIHLDWHAVHYLKVEMDKIFGYENFQNEIIWEYGVGGTGKQRWARKHDTLLFYSKTQNWTFNVDELREPYDSTEKVEYKTIKGKAYRRKNPLGRVPRDTWYIPSITNTAKERIGYPTQKPEALLERIIKASSNEGDIVLDAFCGCGTTIAVAERLNRKWIGIDVSPIAIKMTTERLEKIKNSFLKQSSGKS